MNEIIVTKSDKASLKFRAIKTIILKLFTLALLV